MSRLTTADVVEGNSRTGERDLDLLQGPPASWRSWQPNLWFDTQGQDAAEFYVPVFPNSKITNVTDYGDAGPGPAATVLTVDFSLDGQEYTAINGGQTPRVPGTRSGVGVLELAHCPTDGGEMLASFSPEPVAAI